jgi:hypothetical protein
MSLKAINKDNLSPLEHIIFDSYIDWELIVQIVRENDFEESLYPGFKHISDKIKSNKLESIPNLVGSLLTTINEKLKDLKGKEKQILEDLSIEMFLAQRELLLSKKNGNVCWERCIPAIKDTCDFKGYDFEVLSRMLKLNFVKPPNSALQRTLEDLPYYDWLGSKKALPELIKDLRSKQWIRNVNEFKRIFTPSIKPDFKFCAPTENKEKLLVLFTELKRQSLIVPKRNKGHLYPLYLYGVDLEKKLFEKEPKRYLENLKRKKLEYETVLEEVHKLIRLNK